MTYIYAYSNHKEGLSRLRRMAVYYGRLLERGEAVEMLTNDYRAAAAVRDYGVPACITIDTVWDIDAVAEQGDRLVIDTPEQEEGWLERYMALFGKVTLVTDVCEQQSLYGEEILLADPMTDPYFAAAKEQAKREVTVLFYGDSDPRKQLLSEVEKWREFGMELLLGEYFYAGYEEALAAHFCALHEPESYREVIAGSRRVVTLDKQTAYEAAAAGAEVIYIAESIASCQEEKMANLAIKRMDFTALQSDFGVL